MLNSSATPAKTKRHGIVTSCATDCLGHLSVIPAAEDEGMDAVLIMYDANRKGIWTMLVDKRGATPSSVKLVSDKLEEIGYLGGSSP